MKRETIDQAIREAVAESLPELDQPDLDGELTSDLGLDSVQVMNMVMEIEDRLDVSIPVNVLGEVRTLRQLGDQLMMLTGRKVADT